MTEEMKSGIIAALISGAFGLVTVYFSWWLQQHNAEKIEKLNEEVFRPRIIIGWSPC